MDCDTTDTAFGRKGYTLHVHTAVGRKGTPCTSILLAVERDTPCTFLRLSVGRIHPERSILLGGGGKGYTLHVHTTAWWWKGIHPARPYCWRWKGYTLHVHTAGGGKWFTLGVHRRLLMVLFSAAQPSSVHTSYFLFFWHDSLLTPNLNMSCMTLPCCMWRGVHPAVSS